LKCPLTARRLAFVLLAASLALHVLVRMALTLPWADDWIFIGRAPSVPVGLQVALQRLHTWSARPLSELTLFITLPASQQLNLPPERLIQPLLLVSYLQGVALLCWPLLLAPVRRLPYARITGVASLAALVWLFTLRVDAHDVFFWGASAVAYVPAFAAILSATVLLTLNTELRPFGLAELSILQLSIAALACEWALLPLVLLPLHLYKRASYDRSMRWHGLSVGLLLAIVGPVFLRRLQASSQIPLRQISPAGDSWFGELAPLGSWLGGASWLVLALAALWLLPNASRVPVRLAGLLLAVGAVCALFFGLQTTIAFDQVRYGLVVLFFVVPGSLLLLVRFSAGWISCLQPFCLLRLPRSLVLIGWLALFISSPSFRDGLALASRSPGLSPPRLVVRGTDHQSGFLLAVDHTPGRAIAPGLPPGLWRDSQVLQAIAAQPVGQRYTYKVIAGLLQGYRLRQIWIEPGDVAASKALP
jgi:hypothetical protein